jgi:hypothetical protein
VQILRLSPLLLPLVVYVYDGGVYDVLGGVIEVTTVHRWSMQMPVSVHVLVQPLERCRCLCST